MKKIALLVGINKYKQPGADLRGCVNDVINMRKLLNEIYGFALDDIRVLTDKRATKNGILKRLNHLVDAAPEGSEIVFHYSGHGSQVRDRNCDELNDKKDEILCPHNLNWNDPLTDDDLAAIFKKVPKSVSLTMICDSCHSGSMTRSFFEEPIEGIDPNPIKERFIVPPIDIQARSEGRQLTKSNIGMKQLDNGEAASQNHVLMSGCKDDQTSADAYIDKKYQGALTATLIKVLRHNPKSEWNTVHSNVRNLLNKGGYSQIPVLSGDNALLNKSPFGIK